MSCIADSDCAGEYRTSVFCQGELRQSHDWINNKWNRLEERMDIADSLFSDTMINTKDLSDSEQFTKEQYTEETNGSSLPADMVQDENIPSGDSSSDGEAGILDLTKDSHFNKLRWKRKRRREQTEDGSSHKKQHCEASSGGSQDAAESSACGGFVLPKSLTVDHENCKIGGDPLFNTPLAISSLVMSQ